MKELQVIHSITDRESSVVESYLQEVRRISLIDAQEESRLAQQIKAGDQAALEKLIKTNLRFVVSVAKKYQHQGLPLADLIAEGNIGLIKAAKKFDETRGFKFISFAVWWIRQSMLEAIATQTRLIRLPVNRTGVITRMNKGLAVFEQQHERSPTPQELAEFLEADIAEIKEAIEILPKTWSFDHPLSSNDEDAYCLLDKVAATDEPADKQLLIDAEAEEITHLLRCLTDKEQTVLKATYGLLGQEQLVPERVAELIGMSVSSVSIQLKQALTKLRENL